ncbi:MAG TPA: tetratricopeptide repeat protein [Candidatus Acidoferrales bacterium]|nr:tetratricopeptide repeat protein [Candidatus Acidoferrales bacterium]
MTASLRWATATTAFAPRVSEAQVTGQSNASATAEAELQTGIALTQQGRFSEAIPHFVAARGHVSNQSEYAANFNLALCYLGTSQFNDAIQLLNALKASGGGTAAVNSLLAQAYIGSGKEKEAFNAFQQAFKQTPQDERLYLLVAEECMDRQSYEMGIDVLNIGVQHLPHSSRLHYERGVFFSFQNAPDPAAADFDLASKLAPGTDISYMAAGQKALLEGNISQAVRITREGIHKGHDNYILLAIFGNAVVHSGAGPDQSEFREAQAALQESVAERPNYSISQAALGELYLVEGRLDDAITHLEAARKLAPDDASVYSHLAIAYRRKGNVQEAERMLTKLASLNQKQVAKYKSDSPDHRAGYVSSGRPPRQP